jgi:hypothetical protein
MVGESLNRASICGPSGSVHSTNAIENLNSGITTYSHNVKRWRGGSMVVRWTLSG